MNENDSFSKGKGGLPLVLFCILITLSISYMCVKKNNNIEACLIKDARDRSECFEKYFSVNGPIAKNKNVEGGFNEMFIIHDPRNINILCDELYQHLEDELMNNLMNVALINNASCVCDCIRKMRTVQSSYQGKFDQYYLNNCQSGE